MSELQNITTLLEKIVKTQDETRNFTIYGGLIAVAITTVIIMIIGIIASIFAKRYLRTLAEEITNDSKKLLGQIKKADTSKKNSNLDNFVLNFNAGADFKGIGGVSVEVTVYGDCNKAQLLMPCCKSIESELDTLSKESLSGKSLPLRVNILCGTNGLGKSYTAHLYAYALKGKKKFVIKVDSEDMAKRYGTFSQGLLALKQFIDEISSYYSDSAFVLLLDEFDGYLKSNSSNLYKKDIGECLEQYFKNSLRIQVLFAMNNSFLIDEKYWNDQNDTDEKKKKNIKKAVSYLYSDNSYISNDRVRESQFLEEGQLSKLVSVCSKYDFVSLSVDDASKWIDDLDFNFCNVFTGIFGRELAHVSSNREIVKNHSKKIKEKVKDEIKSSAQKSYSMREINEFVRKAFNTILKEAPPTNHLKGSCYAKGAVKQRT